MSKYDEIIKKSGIGEVDQETYAMLMLIAYRAYLGTGSQYSALFALDFIDSCKISKTKNIKERIVSVLMYFVAFINSRRRRNEVTLISDTLLSIERYSDVVSHLLENRKVVSFLNYVSFFGYIRNKGQKADEKKFNSRSVCVGSRICGQDFINVAMDIYDVFCEIVSGDEVKVPSDKITAFSRIIAKQIQVIRKQLVRRNVRCFITVNQYNAPDLLTIMACRDAGIVTKQLLHYSMVVFPTDFYNAMPRYVFTEVDSVWNQADIVWAERYSNSINLLYEHPLFEVVGCPEIDRQRYGDCRGKYTREKSIVLFAPCIVDYDSSLNYYVNHKDGKNVDEYIKWRREIYDAVYDFAKRNQLNLYIRFHPGVKDKSVDYADHDYLRERSFNILGYDREDFYRAICTCKYAVTMSSSSLYMALQYGCQCICIDDTEKHDFCGLNIIRLTVKELHSYTVSDETDVNIIPDYFDDDKLISSF